MKIFCAKNDKLGISFREGRKGRKGGKGISRHYCEICGGRLGLLSQARLMSPLYLEPGTQPINPLTTTFSRG